ncbi:hypothetical protein MBLNU230_g0164t1 [Neophaeotheca triangularis]
MLKIFALTATIKLAVSHGDYDPRSDRSWHRHENRQVAELGLDDYVYQVNTARFAIGIIRSGQAAMSCDPANLVEVYNEQGYDGQYAQQLLCASAAGFDLFPDVEEALHGTDITLAALRARRANPAGTLRGVDCDAFDVDVLYQADLDGAAIQDLVCPESPTGSATRSSVVPAETNSSVAASSMTSGTVVNPTSLDNSATLEWVQIGTTFGNNTTVQAAQTSTTVPTFSLQATASTSVITTATAASQTLIGGDPSWTTTSSDASLTDGTGENSSSESRLDPSTFTSTSAEQIIIPTSTSEATQFQTSSATDLPVSDPSSSPIGSFPKTSSLSASSCIPVVTSTSTLVAMVTMCDC